MIGRLEKYSTMLSRWLYWIAGRRTDRDAGPGCRGYSGHKTSGPSDTRWDRDNRLFWGWWLSASPSPSSRSLKGHIQVDFFIMKLPTRPRQIIDAVMTFCGIVFFIILAWRSWDYGMTMQRTGEVSMTQRIPFLSFYLWPGFLLPGNLSWSWWWISVKR